jgi:hypothetical protein
MSKACSTYGERRGEYTVFVWIPEGKRQFGRHKGKCEEILKWMFKKSDGEAGIGFI